MSSTAKTTNYGLNQWAGSDKPERVDFNADNETIDKALAAIRDSASTFKVLGLYATVDALEAAHPVGASGDAYAVGTAEDNEIYVWDTPAAAWVSIGAIQGATGDVVGPSSSTDDQFVLFDGTSGKLVKNASLGISDLESALSDIVALQSGLSALISEITTGWIPDSDAWTYVSTNSFSVPGDKTSKYGAGDPLRWTQNGTVRESNVYSVTYDLGTDKTVITKFGGYKIASGDCDVLNTATYPITNKYYSKMRKPQGFTEWFNWIATNTGFSSPPTDSIYLYRVCGKTCEKQIRQITAGTSNATTFTISLVVPAVTLTNMVWAGVCTVTDNGVLQSNLSVLYVLSAATSMTVYKDVAATAFTASGGKRLGAGNISYEYA